MFQFIRVSKTPLPPKHDRSGDRPRNPILLECSVAFSHRLNAHVEGSPTATAMLLQLLSGLVKPDSGFIFAKGVLCSPVVNLGGLGGGLLIPQLSVRENVAFQARLSHFNISTMLEFVVETCECQGQVDVPVLTLGQPLKRAIEATLFSLLRYDCYIVDHFDLLPDFAKIQLFYVVRQRGAGLFFTAARPAVAKQFRDSTIAVANGTLVVASDS